MTASLTLSEEEWGEGENTPLHVHRILGARKVLSGSGSRL